jgi:micrococcal nuclease
VRSTDGTDVHRRRAVLTVAILVGALALTAGCVEVDTGTQDASTYNATVTDVADGDTIDVRLADGSTDTVRLLGIDTPEVHVENEPEHFAGVPDTAAGRECLYRAGTNASAYVRHRLAGERVRLDVDEQADRRGSYDRLLAYVYHDGENLNRVLLARGHAGVYPATFRLRDRFEATAADAREADRGLWRCRDPAG